VLLLLLLLLLLLFLPMSRFVLNKAQPHAHRSSLLLNPLLLLPPVPLPLPRLPRPAP
jgi:hypothetical protein